MLARRERRARAWLAAATAAFQGSSEAAELHSALELHLQRMEAALQCCRSQCAECLLPCCQIGPHDAHDCDTDHKCKADCSFCAAESAEAPATGLAGCREKAGHGGKHMCAEVAHTCGQDCALKAALNCRGTCGLEPGHGGRCDCKSGNHLCGKPCALPGCGARCVAPHGSEHAQCACENKLCPEVRSRCCLR